MWAKTPENMLAWYAFDLMMQRQEGGRGRCQRLTGRFNRNTATTARPCLSAEAEVAQPPAAAVTATAPADTRPRNCFRVQDEDRAWLWCWCPAPSSAALIDTDNSPARVAVASPVLAVIGVAMTRGAAVDAEVKVELLVLAIRATATPANRLGVNMRSPKKY